MFCSSVLALSTSLNLSWTLVLMARTSSRALATSASSFSCSSFVRTFIPVWASMMDGSMYWRVRISFFRANWACCRGGRGSGGAKGCAKART